MSSAEKIICGTCKKYHRSSADNTNQSGGFLQKEKIHPFAGLYRPGKGWMSKTYGIRAASSPSQSSLRDASSPKVGALGSPRRLHLFAKASPFGRGGFAKQRRRGRGRYPCAILLNSTPSPVCERPGLGWIFSFLQETAALIRIINRRSLVLFYSWGS